MAESENLTTEPPAPVRAVPRPLPDVVLIAGDARLRFTPRELRIIREQTGSTLTELMQEEMLTLTAWLKLRRSGWPDVRWSDLDDIDLEFVASEKDAADPLADQPSTTSPHSAGTGA